MSQRRGSATSPSSRPGEELTIRPLRATVRATNPTWQAFLDTGKQKAKPLELPPPSPRECGRPARLWPQLAHALMGLLHSIAATTSGHH